MAVPVALAVSAGLVGGAATSEAAAGGPAGPGRARLPTTAQLQSALLGPQDVGGGATAGSSGDGGSTTTVSGCAPLVAALSAPAHPQGQAQVELTAGGAGPYLTEELTTEPAARLAADYARVSDAMTSCHRLTFTSGGTVLDFALSPIHFGGPGSVADRMDAVVQGVEVNGYLAVERLGPVMLAYTFFQVGGGSSQLASAYYRDAVDKVHRVIPGTAPGQAE